jgi:hypothetical protein
MHLEIQCTASLDSGYPQLRHVPTGRLG